MNQDKNNLEHCQGKKVIYEVPIFFLSTVVNTGRIHHKIY